MALARCARSGSHTDERKHVEAATSFIFFAASFIQNIQEKHVSSIFELVIIEAARAGVGVGAPPHAHTG